MVVRDRPLAVGVADAVVAAGADPVAAIGGDATALAAVGLEVVADDWPGAGPAAAVTTAMRWALRCDADIVLVVACDHPDVDPADLAGLAAAVVSGAAVAVATADDRAHPTVSAWRVDAAAVDVAEGFIKRGGRRLDMLAEALAGPTGGPLLVEVAAATCADIDDATDLRRYAGED